MTKVPSIAANEVLILAFVFNSPPAYESSRILKKILKSFLPNLDLEKAWKSSENGKPFLEGNPLYFNLSHSADRWLLAICRSSEVGIDIENLEKQRDFLKIADRFFPEKDSKILKQLIEVNPSQLNRSFYQIWTRYEALIKCLGGSAFEMREQAEKYLQKEIRLELSSIDSLLPINWKSFTASLAHSVGLRLRFEEIKVTETDF